MSIPLPADRFLFFAEAGCGLKWRVAPSGVRYLRHAECLPGGGVRFRLWAPAHDQIGLMLGKDGRCLPMKSTSGGCHELEVPNAGAGWHEGPRRGVTVPAGGHPRPSEVIDPWSIVGVTRPGPAAVARSRRLRTALRRLHRPGYAYRRDRTAGPSGRAWGARRWPHPTAVPRFKLSRQLLLDSDPVRIWPSSSLDT
jgi:hypothetical protein